MAERELDLKQKDGMDEMLNESYAVVDETEECEGKQCDNIENSRADNQSENAIKSDGDAEKDLENSEIDFEPEDVMKDDSYNELENGSKGNKIVDDEMNCSFQENPDETVEEAVETHPYEDLINNFQFTKDQTVVTNIGTPKSLTETPLQIIHNKHELMKLLPLLRTAKEIGVDVFYKSSEFKSFISLMAISTRDKDYIIDGRNLRKDLFLLTEIFVNPNIVKIMTRTEQQLPSLQRLLRLFVVNVFDLTLAMKSLGQVMSVDQALKERYSINRDKKINGFELIQRPMSEFVKKMGRSGAHYYVYLYHDLKDELLKTSPDLFNDVMSKCRDLTKTIHSKQEANFGIQDLDKLTGALKKEQSCQTEVLKRLFNWRLKTAHKCNRPPTAVLPNYQLIKLAASLPFNFVSLKLCASSKFVEAEIDKVLSIISQTTERYNIIKKKTPMMHRLENTINSRGTLNKFGAPKTNTGAPANKQSRTEVYNKQFPTSVNQKRSSHTTRFNFKNRSNFKNTPRMNPWNQTFQGSQQPNFDNLDQVNKRPQVFVNTSPGVRFNPGPSSTVNPAFQYGQSSSGLSSHRFQPPQAGPHFSGGQGRGQEAGGSLDEINMKLKTLEKKMFEFQNMKKNASSDSYYRRY